MYSEYFKILIQIIGFGGVFFFLASYQLRSNKLLFVTQTLGCLLFVLQFALLGAYSGCLTLLVNIVRNMMLSKYKQWKWVQWKGWVVLFSVLCILIAWKTWNGPVSLLPLIGTIAGTVGYWSNNAKYIRLTNLLVNSPCMLTYALLVHSWGGVLNALINILSIVVSIIRFGWKALDGDTIAKKQAA